MSRRSMALTLDGIHKRYGRHAVLRGAGLELHPGRVTALLGPNGAGKTTLIKVALGLVRPDAGSLALLGVEAGQGSTYRRDIGYMPQLPRFPGNLSARELAAMLDDLRGFQGPPDEELVGAFGLEPWMDRPFRALSGGTRQKVNAALAFRYRTPVLILDEPTAGLDPVAARILKAKIRGEVDAGTAVLLTSHDLGQVTALADDVVFLVEGTVCFAGARLELLSRTGQADLEAAVASLLTGGGGASAEPTDVRRMTLHPGWEVA
ncbi:MAG: ABC transporter ATP-binding protein [Gemmatimonadota bacterium]|nr:ABC transporter ATP-binding protein [Gemmatimonadota bacterium]